MTELATIAATQPVAVEALFGVYGKTWLADTAVQEKILCKKRRKKLRKKRRRSANKNK